MPSSLVDAGPISMRAFFSSPWRILVLLSLVLLPCYSWFYFGADRLWASPDERTLFVFAQHWSQHRSFLLPRTIESDAVLPRSVTIVGDAFAPTGFLGLFLIIGTLMRLFGITVALLIVPALAAVTPIALFSLFRRWFRPDTALWSSILWGVFPAWMYYANRGFLPNVAFLALLILSLALAALAIETKQRLAWCLWLLSGLLLGLSLIVRPVEVLWVAPLLVLLWWWAGKPWRAIAGAISALVPVAWLAVWQANTYGHWYSAGYGSVNNTAASQAGFFPFGLHPLIALQHVVDQAFWVYGWLLPFVMIGGVWLFKQCSKNAAQKKYSLVFVGVTAYLVLYYGSWNISDHPDQNWISIGVAYNRYWLPVFALMMPMIAEGVRIIASRLRLITPSGGFAFLLFSSVATAFALGEDSLWVMRQHGVEYKQLQRFIALATEQDAVMIVGREEKAIWPLRQVIYQADNSFAFVDSLPALAKSHPIYWVPQLPPSHIQDLEQRVFAPKGLRLEWVDADLEHGYKLYLIRF